MSNHIDAPEQIFGWLDGYLSIARHYGGCSYNGHRYVIDYSAEGQPLVREDVMKKLAKDRKRKATMPQAQQDILE